MKKSALMFVIAALFLFSTAPLLAGCHWVDKYCPKVIHECVKVSKNKCVKWEKRTISVWCGQKQECESKD